MLDKASMAYENDDDFAVGLPNTTFEPFIPDPVINALRTSFLPCMYTIICFFGLVGNSMVLVVFIFYEKLKSLTDVFLVNLAIADILFLFTLPFLAYSASHGWVFGLIMCKVIFGMYNINLYTSMLTLTCITVDRFIAVAQATKARRLQEKIRLCGIVTCFVVWAISILFSIPQFKFHKLFEYDGMLWCLADYEPYHVGQVVRGFQMTAGFFLPLSIMIICYSVIIKTIIHARGLDKQKSLKIIIVIVAVFIATQLPYNIIMLMSIIEGEFHLNHHFERAVIITETLAYVHACLNPILYFFVGAKFRKTLRKIVKEARCFKHQREVSSQFKSSDDPSKTFSASNNIDATSMIRMSQVHS
ncbi:C-X-C chemokine receptor type 6 [Pleurodeles waltl]|uniref:C-X-C chemokine receptor type 6 n=1 Tax=Pleurodeles waltl TaxID=8319 RepID=UPI0037096C4F